MEQGSAAGGFVRRLRTGGLRAIVSIALAGVGVQVLTFLSGPLVARMLGPDGRGLMVMVVVVASLFSALGVGGLPAAASHAVGTAGGASRDVLRGLLPIWCLAMIVPAILAAGLTAVLVRNEDQWLLLAGLGMITCYLQCLNYLVWAMLQGEGAIQRVNAQRLIGIGSYVAVIVVLFLFAPTEHAPIIVAAYAASLLGGVALGWFMLKRPTGDTALRASRRDVHVFARQGWTSGLKPLDSLGLDQLLVGFVLGQAALGIYAVAISVTSLPIVALTGIALALLPRLASAPAARSIPMMRRWVLASAGIATAMILAIEVVLGPAIRIFFGHEFVPAIGIGRLLVIAWGFLALRRVLTAAAQAQGKVAAASIAEAVSTVLLVVGVYVGMKVDDLDGVAWVMIGVSAFCCAWIALIITWRSGDAGTVHPPPADELDPSITDAVEHRLT
jgi:O-antigen/teichoic acid export membrane protein